MAPKEGRFNQSETASGKDVRVVWRFPCSSATTRDGEIIQRQHFCHHGGTICHPKSSYVTTKLHGTYVYKWMQQLCDIFRPSNVHVSYRRRMPATLNWPRQNIGGGCRKCASCSSSPQLDAMCRLACQCAAVKATPPRCNRFNKNYAAKA